MSIKKIIAIGSAKGGVGKSSITASVALHLSKNYSVGILDADIYGPNQHLLFDIKEKPSFIKSSEKKLLKPITKKNIQFSSVGFLLEEEKAAMWRGPILSSTIKQLFYSTKWNDLDFLFIDMPPGTGDAYLTVMKDINIDDFSIKAAEIGNDALSGKDGPAKDTLIYTGALTLSIIKNIDFNDAAEQIKKVINSGKAKEFFYNAK